ncbi:MAG: 50S ribosomal protein L21 [SAR202 cluster bacterium]|nr:50S ribosomal protein L21 [SAR202 cluster bacterium]|tara:strand:- start:2057 stop:2449 length:393 start_codon:yes stop_codon:yes gene_type:complete
MDYAVFKTGGKQYRVKPGDTLDVELLSAPIDSVAEFGEVLALSDGGEVTIGSPLVEGAKVTAQVLSHYKDRKLMVYKYKAKNRYRRKRGHRQTYTRLQIQDIELTKPRASRRRASTAAAAPEAEGGEESN